MSDIAIKVENLSKCYPIFDTPRDRLKQMIIPRLQRAYGFSPRKYYREFWALRDVSFEVKRGETVGIIGRNGSGKSTLLQIICGTLNSTGGNVKTIGKIAALLELGSGFNPEFTGRENVFLGCSILGLSEQEIKERFDDIAAFADIGEFIEQPVKTYSSGMFVRLAFAVNVMSKPDILIVDEALAVGDVNFQAKCMTAMKKIQNSGATIFFVSHDISSIKSLCNAAIYLEKGEIKLKGKASDVAEHYTRVMRDELNAHLKQEETFSNTVEVSTKIDREPLSKPRENAAFKISEKFENEHKLSRYGNGHARTVCVELLSESEEPLLSVDFGQKVKIRIHFILNSDCEVFPIYYVADDKKNLVLGASPRTCGSLPVQGKMGEKYVVTYETHLPLQEGFYSIEIQLNKSIVLNAVAEFLDVIPDAIVFSASRKNNMKYWSKVYLENTYNIYKC